MLKLKSIFFLILIYPCIVYCDNFLPQATYDICFTPRQDCTEKIINTIDSAKKTIFLQGYYFTDINIANALIDAKNRGVKIEIILDKTQRNNAYSTYGYLSRKDIPIYIDYKARIAHNKVIIVDAETTITGSFNYTTSAQLYNAENIIIIKDKIIAAKYYGNFVYRKLINEEKP
jgi:phosphatidylserine/phosphatidylglycerophosphate/cardiolipin synthase-like enzyme